MVIIPLPSTVSGVFEQRTRLGERDYIVRYRHNSRVDSWTIDLEALQDGGATLPVMTGKKLFIGHDLLRRCESTERPPGSLVIQRFDGTRDVPTGTSLKDCKLIYLEPGETLGAS